MFLLSRGAAHTCGSARYSPGAATRCPRVAAAPLSSGRPLLAYFLYPLIARAFERLLEIDLISRLPSVNH